MRSRGRVQPAGCASGAHRANSTKTTGSEGLSVLSLLWSACCEEATYITQDWPPCASSRSKWSSCVRGPSGTRSKDSTHAHSMAGLVAPKRCNLAREFARITVGTRFAVAYGATSQTTRSLFKKPVNRSACPKCSQRRPTVSLREREYGERRWFQAVGCGKHAGGWATRYEN